VLACHWPNGGWVPARTLSAMSVCGKPWVQTLRAQLRADAAARRKPWRRALILDAVVTLAIAIIIVGAGELLARFFAVP
jgi:hypothetical protein